jgi:hypothetical protein
MQKLFLILGLLFFQNLCFGQIEMELKNPIDTLDETHYKLYAALSHASEQTNRSNYLGSFKPIPFDTINQYILQYIPSQTFHYYGGIIIYDTANQIEKKVIFPFQGTQHQVRELKEKEEEWFILFESGIFGRDPASWKASTKDFGTTWILEKL